MELCRFVKHVSPSDLWRDGRKCPAAPPSSKYLNQQMVLKTLTYLELVLCFCDQSINTAEGRNRGGSKAAGASPPLSDPSRLRK